MNKFTRVEVVTRNHGAVTRIDFQFDDKNFPVDLKATESRQAIALRLRAIADQMNKTPDIGGPPGGYG